MGYTDMNEYSAEKSQWDNAEPGQRFQVAVNIWDSVWNTDLGPRETRTWVGTKAEIEAQAAECAATVYDRYLFLHMEIDRIEVL